MRTRWKDAKDSGKKPSFSVRIWRSKSIPWM